MATAIESGFPVGAASRATTNPKTATFSTAGPSLLVLITHTAGAAVSAVSSPSLTWTRRLGPTGSIWIYTAPSTGALTNETVSVTFGAGSDGAISVYSITGADDTALTNTARTSGTSGAIQFSFTSNSAGSMLLWSTIDFNQGSAGSAATGNTVDLDNLDGNGERYVSGHYTTQPAAGTYTLGESNTSTNWQIGAIEVPASTSGSSGSATDTSSVSDSAVGAQLDVGASTDTSSVSDSAAGTLQILADATDTSTVADSSAGVATFVGGGADSAVVTDVATGAQLYIGDAVDSASVTDSALGAPPVDSDGASDDLVAVFDSAAGYLITPSNDNPYVTPNVQSPDVKRLWGLIKDVRFQRLNSRYKW